MTTSLAAISQADQTWHVRPEDPFATADRLPEGIDQTRCRGSAIHAGTTPC